MGNISVLDRVKSPGIVSVDCGAGSFQHELVSPGLERGVVLDLAPPLYSPGSPLKAYDRSGYGYHGDFRSSGHPKYVQEDSGAWAMDFDSGTPDYIEIPAAANALNFISESFSMVVRVKIDTSQENGIFTRGYYQADGWIFHVDGSERLTFRTNQDSANQDTVSSASTVSLQTWCTIGFSRNGTAVSLFYEGTETGYTGQGTHSNPLTSSRAVKIGLWDHSTPYGLDGKILYLAVLDYALSEGQHHDIHNDLVRWG